GQSQTDCGRCDFPSAATRNQRIEQAGAGIGGGKPYWSGISNKMIESELLKAGRIFCQYKLDLILRLRALADNLTILVTETVVPERRLFPDIRLDAASVRQEWMATILQFHLHIDEHGCHSFDPELHRANRLGVKPLPGPAAPRNLQRLD